MYLFLGEVLGLVVVWMLVAAIAGISLIWLLHGVDTQDANKARSGI